MAKKYSVTKWIFVLLAVCVLLPIILVFSLNPSLKRHHKTDYLAEYNRISKPINFDPNDNAAPYFDKAFDIMTEEPNDFESFRRLWPADMNEDQLRIAKQWVTSNSQTIECLKEGISKKYYWKKLKQVVEPFFMTEADLNYLTQFRKAAYLLCLEAKLMAYQGHIEPALGQLTEVYKMGTFFVGPKAMIEQLVGIACGTLAEQSAFQILEHTKPPMVFLEDFQQRISNLSSDKPFLISFNVERLQFDYGVQQYLTGHADINLYENPELYFRRLFLGTVGRPWVAWERRKADIVYGYVATAAHKTPWELHKEGNDVNIVTYKMTKGTLFLRIFAPAFDRVIFISYRAQVQTDALIATTAILRYKADKGRYPKDLQELVAASYLDKLPMDPFSGGPLTYKVTDDNFILYSFAENFKDDGGKHDLDWAREGEGDYVFWPVQKMETTGRTKKRN
jgi:hypothetical protein